MARWIGSYQLKLKPNSFNLWHPSKEERAGRSVVDRSLGMGEAAGSIPAQSTHFLSEPKCGYGLFFLKG